MGNFRDLHTTKKGELGEKFCIEYFEKQGFAVASHTTNVAHPYDISICKDKVDPWIVDIKTKSRRTSYPDTGLDTADLNHYNAWSKKHNMPVLLVFVDEHFKKIYYGNLGFLNQEYKVPHIGRTLTYPIEDTKNGITYFAMDSLNEMCDLTDEQCKQLKEYTNRNYDYKDLKIT